MIFLYRVHQPAHYSQSHNENHCRFLNKGSEGSEGSEGSDVCMCVCVCVCMPDPFLHSFFFPSILAVINGFSYVLFIFFTRTLSLGLIFAGTTAPVGISDSSNIYKTLCCTSVFANIVWCKERGMESACVYVQCRTVKNSSQQLT